MKKGYWVAFMEVDDAEAYEAYKAANAVPFAEYGARFVIRGGMMEAKEGTPRPRCVVIEFPSLAAARACYDSAAYHSAKALRDPVARGELVIVEGA